MRNLVKLNFYNYVGIKIENKTLLLHQVGYCDKKYKLEIKSSLSIPRV